MKKEFLLERQGQVFAKYAGLLDAAHDAGLVSIETSVLQLPSPENAQTAICYAIVTLSADGVEKRFSGIGDANPANVNRAMGGCILRMAETRSKARALRDAVNFAGCSEEELDDVDAGAAALSTVSGGASKPSLVRGQASCPTCHAPVGKPHATGCSERAA